MDTLTLGTLLAIKQNLETVAVDGRYWETMTACRNALSKIIDAGTAEANQSKIGGGLNSDDHNQQSQNIHSDVD